MLVCTLLQDNVHFFSFLFFLIIHIILIIVTLYLVVLSPKLIVSSCIYLFTSVYVHVCVFF